MEAFILSLLSPSQNLMFVDYLTSEPLADLA